MNVESTSSNITTKKADSSTSSSSVTNPSQDTKTSFQDELNSAKLQETADQKNIEEPKIEQNNQSTQSVKTSDESNPKEIKKETLKTTNNVQTTQNAKIIEENTSQQFENEKLENIQSSQALQNVQNLKAAEENNIKLSKNEKIKNDQNKTTNNTEDELFIKKSYNELNSKIAAINDLKTSSQSKIQGTISKTDDTKADSSLYCSTIKMDNNDISFYLSLVNNQQLSAQCGQLNNTNQAAATFSEVKSEATQKTVQVSATLLDALNESAKTNKPVRIDFDSDVAVIMKVDKNGVLSANFIPGSAAVEQYLRNNIESLRQNFDNQNLPYNELTYSNREKQHQEEKQSKNKNKENSDE